MLKEYNGLKTNKNRWDFFFKKVLPWKEERRPIKGQMQELKKEYITTNYNFQLSKVIKDKIM